MFLVVSKHKFKGLGMLINIVYFSVKIYYKTIDLKFRVGRIGV